MAWRSVVISQPATLSLEHSSLVVTQNGQVALVPLEDISVIVIDQPGVKITSSLLAACAESKIATIFVGRNHMPIGILLPYLPHSRSFKILQIQMEMSQPRKKRIWQEIIKRKICNQSQVLGIVGRSIEKDKLKMLSEKVLSGDSNNRESVASQIYFPALFGRGFSRNKDIFFNGALNYGYSIVRSAIARSLVAHGFITSLGINHRSELNQFNLADDLFEPFRPYLDLYIFERFSSSSQTHLDPSVKAVLVDVLNHDVYMTREGKGFESRTLLSATEKVVIEFGSRMRAEKSSMNLPIIRETSTCIGEEGKKWE